MPDCLRRSKLQCVAVERALLPSPPEPRRRWKRVAPREGQDSLRLPSNCVRRSQQADQRRLRLNAPGVIPVARRKARVKLAWDEKQHARATSPIFISPQASIASARCSLRRAK